MKTSPGLHGVPETMLWTLYNRATEARRSDRILDDPESIRIADGLDYDFARHFGDPDPMHAVRAVESDRALRSWMAAHPAGVVVSLGEGLDTQALRVDDGRVRWITVDLPEAIAIRSRFLPETDRRAHVARSAIDHAWIDELGDARDVFVIAQGLFMYLEEESIRSLIAAIAARAPQGELFFDTIPRWASQRTLAGAKRTPHYQLPAMPWGIDTDELPRFVRGCSPRVREVTLVPYRLPRGPLRWLLGAVRAIRPLATKVPTMVHARFGG